MVHVLLKWILHVLWTWSRLHNAEFTISSIIMCYCKLTYPSHTCARYTRRDKHNCTLCQCLYNSLRSDRSPDYTGSSLEWIASKTITIFSILSYLHIIILYSIRWIIFCHAVRLGIRQNMWFWVAVIIIPLWFPDNDLAICAINIMFNL